LEGGKKGKRRVKGFLRLFMNYGLVASVVVWAAVVGMMAYRLDESPWRWAFVALVLVGFGTIAGIFWIRKYVDRQTKASEQGSKP
jgi:F0F1-type ATP synthase assembly protein I